jgi:hypothetical protein
MCPILRYILLPTFGVFGAVVPALGWFWQSAGSAVATFAPAYFQPDNPPQLTVFPLDGPATKIALPEELPTDSRAIAFSPDGRALFVQKSEPLNRAAGIYKIEFQPPRESVVPGSIGTGEVSCLAVSRTTGKITVSGWSWAHNGGGILEIDPGDSTSRVLPSGSASSCGGGGGIVSPDGARWRSYGDQRYESGSEVPLVT